MSQLTSRIRAWIVRHLFTYLALVVGIAVAASVVLAREEVSEAWMRFDRRLVLPVLALSLLNYALRFMKWQLLLRGVAAGVPVGSSARIYFACFSMVVTPFRLGELYKLVFLKRLHGLALRRTFPVLVVERLTDGAAILALAAVKLDLDLGWPLVFPGVLAATVVGGSLVGRPGVRNLLVGWIRRVPGLGSRADSLDQGIQHHQSLLGSRVLAPALLWSVMAWSAECLGLYLILVGLGASASWLDATWIYAIATSVGNLTFLPGGLGSTEASLVYFLGITGVPQSLGLPATLLVRAATLWFAVAIGLGVTLVFRGALQWRAVQAETEQMGSGD